MPTAKELLDSNQLVAAIEKLTKDVKAKPTDTRQRIFLFELLCFAGEWERAEKQLAVISQQSAQAEIGIQTYLNNIKAERSRQRLMSDSLQPQFFSKPPAYVDFLLNAINR